MKDKWEEEEEEKEEETNDKEWIAKRVVMGGVREGDKYIPKSEKEKNC